VAAPPGSIEHPKRVERRAITESGRVCCTGSERCAIAYDRTGQVLPVFFIDSVGKNRISHSRSLFMLSMIHTTDTEPAPVAQAFF